jgi:hypothetical protein
MYSYGLNAADSWLVGFSAGMCRALWGAVCCTKDGKFIKDISDCRPPLWSCGQSSWPQIQRSGFDSWRYQIIWEVVGLERGPLSLVSTIEELLERKSSGSGLENRDYGRKGSAALTMWHSPQKLALTSPTSGSRSVGIVRSRTQATEFSLVIRDCRCPKDDYCITVVFLHVGHR